MTHGEIITVQFSDDGTFSAGHIQDIQTINNNSNNGNINNVALIGTFTANAAVRFVLSGTNNNSGTDAVTIDNLTINTITTTSAIVPGAPGNNYATSYTENGAAVAIAQSPVVTDSDSALLMGATVKLTNAQIGDVLAIAGALPVGIASSFGPAVAGEITMYLVRPCHVCRVPDSYSGCPVLQQWRQSRQHSAHHQCDGQRRRVGKHHRHRDSEVDTGR